MKYISLIKLEFVTKCIDRIKLENEKTGINFSDAFNFLSELYNSIKASARVKTEEIYAKRGAYNHIVMLNTELGSDDCIDVLTKLLCK